MHLHTFFTNSYLLFFVCFTVLFKTKALRTLYKCSKIMVDTSVKTVLMGVENSLGLRTAVKVHLQTIQYPKSLRVSYSVQLSPVTQKFKSWVLFPLWDLILLQSSRPWEKKFAFLRIVYTLCGGCLLSAWDISITSPNSIDFREREHKRHRTKTGLFMVIVLVSFWVPGY